MPEARRVDEVFRCTLCLFLELSAVLLPSGAHLWMTVGPGFRQLTESSSPAALPEFDDSPSDLLEERSGDIFAALEIWIFGCFGLEARNRHISQQHIAASLLRSLKSAPTISGFHKHSEGRFGVILKKLCVALQALMAGSWELTEEQWLVVEPARRKDNRGIRGMTRVWC